MKKRKIIVLFLTIILVLGMFPVTSSAQGSKLIAMTFDDGPSRYTAQLLDGLKARGVVATFFMNGVNGANGAANYPQLLTRMRDEGHQLANHTYSHIYLSSKYAGRTASEVQKVETLLFTAMGGSYTDLVRLPGGTYCTATLQNAASPIIMWSVDPLDWKYRNADTVYNKIVNGATDGAIVLAHDLYLTSVQGALRAIDTLKQRGYEFVTVSELMRRRGVQLTDGTIYNSAPNRGTNLPGYIAPTVSVSADYQSGAEKVHIYSTDPGLTFRYTTNGTKPTLSSPVYNGIFNIYRTTTLTVAGFDKYGTRTPVTVKKVEIDPAIVLSDSNVPLEAVFSDVSSNLWYSPYVRQVVQSGIMTGKGHGIFDPYGEILISEAIKMACVVNSEYYGKIPSFKQGKPWYQVYVDYAIANGIIGAHDFTDYSAPATRGEMAYIFAHAFPEGSLPQNRPLPKLPDVDNSTPYADSIYALFRAGVLKGTDNNNTIAPDKCVSRVEAAAIIARLTVPEPRA